MESQFVETDFRTEQILSQLSFSAILASLLADYLAPDNDLGRTPRSERVTNENKLYSASMNPKKKTPLRQLSVRHDSTRARSAQNKERSSTLTDVLYYPLLDTCHAPHTVSALSPVAEHRNF
jgi:hypothetical protein